jgi:hypothetical protein
LAKFQKQAEASKEKYTKSLVSPKDMFRGDAKYSEFNEDGVPTTLADGNKPIYNRHKN